MSTSGGTSSGMDATSEGRGPSAGSSSGGPGGAVAWAASPAGWQPGVPDVEGPAPGGQPSPAWSSAGEHCRPTGWHPVSPGTQGPRSAFRRSQHHRGMDSSSGGIGGGPLSQPPSCPEGICTPAGAQPVPSACHMPTGQPALASASEQRRPRGRVPARPPSRGSPDGRSQHHRGTQEAGSTSATAAHSGGPTASHAAVSSAKKRPSPQHEPEGMRPTAGHVASASASASASAPVSTPGPRTSAVSWAPGLSRELSPQATPRAAASAAAQARRVLREDEA